MLADSCAPYFLGGYTSKWYYFWSRWTGAISTNELQAQAMFLRRTWMVFNGHSYGCYTRPSYNLLQSMPVDGGAPPFAWMLGKGY